MFITSLEEMESIVANSKRLAWDGWDVIHATPKANAMLTPTGRFIRGAWNAVTTFPLTEQGWKIPKSLMR
jgi:hypothetical protein